MPMIMGHVLKTLKITQKMRKVKASRKCGLNPGIMENTKGSTAGWKRGSSVMSSDYLNIDIYKCQILYL